jgi:hypothetical protein
MVLAILRAAAARYDALRADIAQLVEHFTRNEGVPGSSPGVGLPRRSHGEARMPTDPHPSVHAYDPVAEAEEVRRARLRRDAALAPSDRLAKIAALCRQAAELSAARRRG